MTPLTLDRSRSAWSGKRRPGRPSLIGLERVAAAPSILEAIRVTPLAVAETEATVDSATAARSVVGHLLTAARDDSDAVTGIAAVHALAAIPGSRADHALADMLRSGPGPLPAHAAWASTGRVPAAELLEPMVDVLIAGRLGSMHAQAALAQWSRADPWLVATALRRGLVRTNGRDGRRHVVETLGLVPDDGVLPDLASVAADRSESEVVRVAAIAAFGDRLRAPMPRSISALAGGDDRVADALRLAESDRALRRLDFGGGGSSQRIGSNAAADGRGLRMAQVHLGAVLDPDLLHSGVGDTGGIATLLVRLGVALARTPGIAEVVTIGRGTVRDVLDVARQPNGGPRFAPVALEPEAGTAFGDAWPARILADRGLKRVIRVHGRPDVIHLRMADAGTLAAANVAAMLGIPTVFSLAPDPHGLIASREASGDLDRRSFGMDDAILHLWYRVHLVERLARQADHVALFPRERLIDRLRELVGIDVMATPGRFTVVPEGIDVAQIRHGAAALAGLSAVGAPDAADPEDAGAGEPGGAPPPDALAYLLDRVAALPPTRHGLPIVLSVGRLNELKGMARLAEAFASDPALRARATLVIVGGDLDDPTPAEAIELARIRAAQAAQPDLATALVLLGHRPNSEVAQLLAAVRHGVGRLIGPDGAYACASRKEEFGLAIVEALAAGLPVVAPLAGGPATYVEEGRTGWLVDTSDPAALARGVARALDLAGRPGRAEYAAETIASRYDISGMAQVMTSIYRRVAIGSRDTMAS
jgi:glycosyltransferase involved in cell wall biosynthesis